MYSLSNVSLSRLNGVDENVVSLIKLSINDSPYDFGVPEYGGLRSLTDQKVLYNKGRTIEGEKITNCDGVIKKSIHQLGFAFDIFLYFDGKAHWDCHEKYEEVANHIKTIFAFMASGGYFVEQKLTWGGDFKSFKDLPHFQVT